jgi:hypothetical protein
MQYLALEGIMRLKVICRSISFSSFMTASFYLLKIAKIALHGYMQCYYRLFLSTCNYEG